MVVVVVGGTVEVVVEVVVVVVGGGVVAVGGGGSGIVVVTGALVVVGSPVVGTVLVTGAVGVGCSSPPQAVASSATARAELIHADIGRMSVLLSCRRRRYMRRPTSPMGNYPHGKEGCATPGAPA